MTHEQQMEKFSFAFVHAVAARVGYKSGPPPDADDESVDLCIHATGVRGTIRSPRLDLQVKATTTTLSQDGLHFFVKLKNYDDLRWDDVAVPRILVVVQLPDAIDNWLEIRTDEMALRYRAWWVSLRGLPATTNDTGRTVVLPLANAFTDVALSGLMTQISQGSPP